MAERRQPRQTTRPRHDGPDASEQEATLTEKVVFINRCAKVVKGGRRFSFSALIVAGDTTARSARLRQGERSRGSDPQSLGIGHASRWKRCRVRENTIPHEVIGEFGGGRVLLRPASPGTGVIAGGGVRAVVEAAGIRDVLAKSLGSSNHANVVKATIEALQSAAPARGNFEDPRHSRSDERAAASAKHSVMILAHTSNPARAPGTASSGSAAAKAAATARPAARATRARRPAPAAASASASKAARCRSSAVCPSAVSTTRLSRSVTRRQSRRPRTRSRPAR